jgi:hypothetical protein
LGVFTVFFLGNALYIEQPMADIIKPASIRSRDNLTPQPQNTIPLVAEGTTYSMVQEAIWLDHQHFAVGRWDGSLGIYTFRESASQGPLISLSVNCPASEGVQMITRLHDRCFMTSNDEKSVIVWQDTDQTWKKLISRRIPYDASFGVANSGVSLIIGGVAFTVIGHASGFISIWECKNPRRPVLLRSIDLRSPTPTNPWNLHNIRSVNLVTLQATVAYIVTGSEDGDLNLLEIPSGRIISKIVYNPRAQRGINSIACTADHDRISILVANCSVGAEDKNLWSFTLDDKRQLRYTDSVNLQIDASALQVFNFDLAFGRWNGKTCFYSATEEGALWMGGIQEGKINPIGYKIVEPNQGAALAFNDDTGHLVMAAYNLYEFSATTGLPDPITSLL